jgi:hydrogenase/urease accessory protein HupE
VKRCIVFCLLAVTIIMAAVASAHEVRPAYLQITETQAGRYAVLWKVPQVGDRVLGLHLQWPASCRDTAPVARALLGHAAVERRVVDCGAGLDGMRIGIDGLTLTMTDVLARVEFRDGRTQTSLVKPAHPYFAVEGRQSSGDVARGYFVLGVEHILGGIDHLLFVLALLLIVRGAGRLAKAITAFTVAHSVTLALATLGFVHVPQAPVEAAIALSIAFVAAEIVQAQRGHTPIALRAPWLVAFAFGLLHGLGFAGALAEVGLPQTAISLALLMFNVGAEAGQLLFIGAALSLFALVRRVGWRAPPWSRLVPPYAIGTVAMLWMIQRVANF